MEPLGSANFRKNSGNTSIFAVIILGVLLVAASAVVFAAPATGDTAAASTPKGGDWTSLTLNYNNSRYQSTSTVTSSNVGELTQAWFIDTQWGVTGTPLVQNGYVYFADWGGNVYSVKASTGAIVWKVNVGGAVSSTVGLGNGMVFVGFGPSGVNTEVVALSQTTGATVWSTQLQTTENAVWASPIVYDGLVYIGTASAGQENLSSWKGEIYALNENTGSVVWSYITAGTAGGAGVWGSVVVDPVLNAIYFGTGNSYVNLGTNGDSYSIVSLNAATGALNWHWQAYGSHAIGGDQDFGSTPNLFTISINGTMYNAIGLGNKNGVYYILNRDTGTILTRDPIGSASVGGIIGLAGFTYQNNNPATPELFIPAQNEYKGNNGVVEALAASQGNVLWRFYTPGTITGSVALIPNAVLVGDADGNLYALQMSSAKVLFHTTLPYGIQGGVTVAEGMVFVGDFANTYGSSPNEGLYAFVP